MNNEIQTTTKDHLILHGLHFKGDKDKPAVLHIHGFSGDYNTQDFAGHISSTLQRNNIAFFSVRLRGSNPLNEIETKQGTKIVQGGLYEKLEDAKLDIDAWIEAILNEGYTQVVLQGHSLGTVKVVRYLKEGSFADKIIGVVLLAPFDKNFLLRKFSEGKIDAFMPFAKMAIKAGKGNSFIPHEFHGHRLTYQTLVSWYTQDELGRIFDFHKKGYRSPILKSITQPVLILAGAKDPLVHPSNQENVQEAVDILLDTIPQAQGEVITDADHEFRGHENIVAEKVCQFIQKITEQKPLTI